jgi:GNAT superfamily N-acetyltransferase
VLRDHLPADAVELVYPADEQPGSFHLAVLDGDAPVAIGSFSVEPAPAQDAAAAAVRLRGMAVDPDRQGLGLGRALLGAACERLQHDGVGLLWANARTSALGFYIALGFVADGPEFLSLELPHRVVVLDLRS